MNTKAVGEKIHDVAASIANSKFVKTIIPTMDELNQTIAGNATLSKSLHNEGIQKNLTTMFQGISIPEEEAINMAKTVTAKNYNESIDKLRDNISKYTDKPVDKVIERAKTITQEEISKKISPDILSTKDKVFKYPLAYWANPDKSIRNTRIATAAASYAGVAIGGRYLTGGTLTTDSYGRKDIAGVPFL